MHIINTISRRQFLAATGAITGTALLNPLTGMKAEAANVIAPKASKKLRLAMVGTGIRGTTMWGRDLMKAYPDYMEFVGLCDKNEGRLETGKRIIGASCPTYTDFEKMMQQAVVESMMSDTYAKRLKEWYKNFADSMTDGTLTGTEQSDLKAQWDQIVSDALAERDAIMQAMGWDSSSSEQQSASSRGFGTEMTHEDAGELSGRFTAVYESNLRIEAAEQQQPDRLLKDKTVVGVGFLYQTVNVDAAVDQSAGNRHNCAVRLLFITHNIAHVGQSGQNTGAVGVAQPSLDAQTLTVRGVNVIVAQILLTQQFHLVRRKGRNIGIHHHDRFLSLGGCRPAVDRWLHFYAAIRQRSFILSKTAAAVKHET